MNAQSWRTGAAPVCAGLLLLMMMQAGWVAAQTPSDSYPKKGPVRIIAGVAPGEAAHAGDVLAAALVHGAARRRARRHRERARVEADPRAALRLVGRRLALRGDVELLEDHAAGLGLVGDPPEDRGRPGRVRPAHVGLRDGSSSTNRSAIRSGTITIVAP